MAEQNRTTPDSLIEELRRDPMRFDFFQALRLIECLHPTRPRLGTAARAADDPVRLGQEPELQFPTSTVASFADATPGGTPVPFLAVRFLGLFGPQGPLPLHLTEYVREQVRNTGDRTFARFVDIFHHRMLCLFYRARANGQPAVHHDRPDEDRFPLYVGSLFGLGSGAMRHRDALPDPVKLFFSGHFACQARHADGLSAILRGFFQVPVRIDEFVGEWMDIAKRDQTRLGHSRTTGALGHSTVIGARVWGCQHKIRIRVGPLAYGQYQAFLPGGTALERLTAIVRNYIGDELVWDVNLVLRRDEVPILALGGPVRLGWTTWAGPRKQAVDADDLRLNPFISAAAA